MGALDDLAKPATAKTTRQQPVINIPKGLMDFGKGALDLLNRPAAALEHIYAAPDASHPDLGGAFNTLIHGAPAGQQDTDRASIRSQLHATDWYSHLPHLAQGTVDTIIDTVADPTTMLGGSGLIRRGATAVGEHALPSAIKAFAGIMQHAPAQVRPALEALGQDAAKIHDATTGGGKPLANMFRSLAAKDGAQGVQQGKRVIAAMTAQGAHQSALSQALNVYLKPLEELKPDEQTQVLRAIHGGKVDALPDDLKHAAQSYETMTDARFYLLGGKKVRQRLQQQGFTLPEHLKTFDNGPVGIARSSNYRANYVTMPHDLDPEEAAQVAAKHGTNLGRINDANLRRRTMTGSVEDAPSLYIDAAKGANAGGARAASRMQLRKTLTNTFGGPAKATLKKNAGTLVPQGESELSPLARQMLGQKAQAVGRDRVGQAAFKAAVPRSVRDALVSEDTRKEPALNAFAALQKGGDIGKGSIFIQPTGHMRNIATLGAVANPAILPQSLANFAKLKFGFMGPAEEYAALGDAAKSGAIGRSYEEATPFLKTLNNIPVAGKPLGKVYGASQKMLWGYDKAAKKAAFDSSLKETGDPLLAGFNVGKQLVNYENAAPWAQNSRFLAPFVRWRAGMPLALGKSIAEHPERFDVLNRATGGALSGSPVQGPDGNDYNFINPVSEINGGLGRYARGSAAASLRGLTYPDPLQYWLHSLPGVYQVSPPNPYNIPENGKDKALFQFTGLSKKSKSKSSASSSGGSALDALMKP